MARPGPSSPDVGRREVTVSTGSPTTLDMGVWGGEFNAWFGGTGAGVTAYLERSPDGGATWFRTTALGENVVFAPPATETVREVENGVVWRVNVTAISSGTLTVRFSQ